MSKEIQPGMVFLVEIEKEKIWRWRKVDSVQKLKEYNSIWILERNKIGKF